MPPAQESTHREVAARGDRVLGAQHDIARRAHDQRGVRGHSPAHRVRRPRAHAPDDAVEIANLVGDDGHAGHAPAVRVHERLHLPQEAPKAEHGRQGDAEDPHAPRREQLLRLRAAQPRKLGHHHRVLQRSKGENKAKDSFPFLVRLASVDPVVNADLPRRRLGRVVWHLIPDAQQRHPKAFHKLGDTVGPFLLCFLQDIKYLGRHCASSKAWLSADLPWSNLGVVVSLAQHHSS